MADISDISSRYIDEVAVLDPVRAARMGVDPTSTELTDYSPAGTERFLDLHRRTAAALRAAEPEDEAERLGKLFLLDAAEGVIGLLEAGEPERTVSNISAPTSSVRLVFDLMPRATAEDLTRLGERLTKVPATLASYRESLSIGLADGRVASRPSVEAVAEQCATWSEGYFASLPPEVDVPARVAGSAYAELGSWLRTEYLPAATEELGCGEERYRTWARYMLGTELDLDETYAWGWDELARIESEKRAVCEEILPGAAGYEEVRDHLNRSPEQLLHGADAYRDWLQDVSDAATARLNGWQFEIPDQLLRCDIGIPPEGSAAAAYYTPPSEDLSTPGRTWFPTVGKTEFTKWDQVTIAYHEAVPGHHLQLGTIRLLPLTRAHKLGFHSAHGEGWALYAERLMDELELFTTPADRLGFLSSQAFRAVRVVIDIGLHTGRPLPDGRPWTFDLASEHLQRHGGYPKPFADSEVLRYISWPAQATTYKLGERAWLNGRDAARAAQGDAFDLKRWHADALAKGALGLRDLEHELVSCGSVST
jgi:uncharacterized protein (DUF885 family)